MRRWIHVTNVHRGRTPVFVHWSVFLVSAALALLSLKSPIYAALAIGCYFAVIAIHETGHAFVARRLGYDVIAIRISVIHGQCVLEAPETEWEEVLVSWGGVLAQVCLVNLSPGPGMDGKAAWKIVPLSWRQWRANRVTRRALRSIARRK